MWAAALTPGASYPVDPFSVAVSVCHQEVFVTDLANDCIVAIGRDGRVLRRFGPGPIIAAPFGITISRCGEEVICGDQAGRRRPV